MAASIGFVYILGNEYMPDLYKIGCTERSPRARADEISNATGVPVPFRVLCYAEFENFQAVEQKIHEWLEGHRVNQSREFFQECLSDAVAFLWFHPKRIAFTDASADSGNPFESELVTKACTEEHQQYLDDLGNPWKVNDPAERERIAMKKRFAAGDFGQDGQDGTEVLVDPTEAKPADAAPTEDESALRLVSGGSA